MSTPHPVIQKLDDSSFIARNPFPGRYTDGLFYADKMRAIHRNVPETIDGPILEIGGGQSGLAAILYPGAEITTIDIDPALGEAACNKAPNVTFVAGDATALPFPDGSFALVTLFDLLEHVDDDAAVAREAMRVLRPGGTVVVTTPHKTRWHYPNTWFMRPICPHEDELAADWGHVRRGYLEDELVALFGGPPKVWDGFGSPLLGLSHDISFSRVPRAARLMLHALAAPVSIVGWYRKTPVDQMAELAAAWQKTDRVA